VQAYRLTAEVFCLSHLDRYVAYVPLKGLVLMVNAAAAHLLAELSDGTFSGPDERNLEVLSTLVDLGIVNGPEVEFHRDDDTEFRPIETTLFLTGACNLRCVYCYAFGGDRPGRMAEQVARRAVDLVAENAGATGAGRFGVNFHGGGEPTLAWDLLTGVTAYGRRLAAERNLKCHVALATNGVLDAGQLAWIVEQVDDVNVSVDGMQAVHDALRPLRDGGGSFAQALETIRTLSAGGRPFGLRMTSTRENVEHLPEAVRFFCETASPRAIHIEPVFPCGRCAAERVAGPTVDAFLRAFRAARDVADRHGIRMYYSGARYPAVATAFCQAAGKSFTVTTEGSVTACYEVVDRGDPRAETFFFGRYDASADRFEFDPERLKRLSQLTVERLAFCRNCFCKYHCAGDCPAKRLAVFEGGVPDGQVARCRIAQELTRDQILSALDRGSRPMRVVAREYRAYREEVESG
jgi:uncharacterized protein